MNTKKYTDEELKERRRQYRKEYRANPERKQRERQRMKKYYSNPEVKDRRKEYLANPEVKEREIQRKKRYYAKPEAKERIKQYKAKPEAKERKKQYQKKQEIKDRRKRYYAKPEVKERRKQYYANQEVKQRIKKYMTSPERKRLESQRNLVRRSKGGYVSSIDRQLIYERDAYKCAYAGCNKIVMIGAPNGHPLQATIDHIIPISKGGLSIYSNMITMCRGCNCNTKKANRSSDEIRLLELAHARNVEFGLVDAKTKWEKGQQDDRVEGMGG